LYQQAVAANFQPGEHWVGVLSVYLLRISPLIVDTPVAEATRRQRFFAAIEVPSLVLNAYFVKTRQGGLESANEMPIACL
jgi:hypothetical protein